MKNIFDYATKELSQDAFLCWLFASWEDSDLQDVVISLLKKFGIKVRAQDIYEIRAFTQICKIDVSIVIRTTGTLYFLFIEDKTDSSEHNQLELYDRKILGQKTKQGFRYPVLETINNSFGGDLIEIPDKTDRKTEWTDVVIKRVFYKTDLLDINSDIPAIERSKSLPSTVPAASMVEGEGWLPFDINACYSFFRKYKNTSNVILYQYIEHLIHKKIKLDSSKRPTDLTDLNEWLAYFRNSLVPELEKCGYLTNLYLWSGKDCGIQIKGNGATGSFLNPNNDLPYIKIGPRNLLNLDAKGNAILCVEIYGREDSKKKTRDVKNKFYTDHASQIEELRERIQSLHDSDPLSFPLAKGDFTKQLAKCRLPARTDKDLINSICICVRQLEKIEKKYRIFM